jgi:dTDP-4-amino-4,6-dideoxygalactose transaminase
MKVPFFDLKAQYASIRSEVQRAIERVLDSCSFSGGPFVAAFEEEFALHCRADECIGVGSGTDALLLILRALGIGAGDEVITVPATFAATAEAILLSGATPVLVDIDEKTYTMDPGKIEPAITPRTRAILPVHLFGHMADMSPIGKIAESRGLALIEDACQAHGAEYRGFRAGSVGIAAAFSFYPSKNLGACGEAGAVTTSSSALAEKIRVLRDHGQSRKYFHDVLGWNSRMDGMQAAILTVKLRHLEEWNRRRRSIATRYVNALSGVEELVLPLPSRYAVPVYHIFAVRTRDRDRTLAALMEREIGCGIHYPIPIHLQKAFAGLGYGRGSFPVAERCAQELLSLPMYPELSNEAVDFVCRSITAVLSPTRAGVMERGTVAV